MELLRLNATQKWREPSETAQMKIRIKKTKLIH